MEIPPSSSYNSIKWYLHKYGSDHNDVLKQDQIFYIFNQIQSLIYPSNLKSEENIKTKTIVLDKNKVIYYDDFNKNTLNNYYVNQINGSSIYYNDELVFINGKNGFGQYLRLKQNLIDINKLINKKINFEIDCIFKKGYIRLNIFEKINNEYIRSSGNWSNKSGTININKKIDKNTKELIFQMDTSRINEGELIKIINFRIYEC